MLICPEEFTFIQIYSSRFLNLKLTEFQKNFDLSKRMHIYFYLDISTLNYSNSNNKLVDLSERIYVH